MPTSPFKVSFSLENIMVLLISQVNILSERQAHEAQMMPMITQRKSYLPHHLWKKRQIWLPDSGLLFSVIHMYISPSQRYLFLRKPSLSPWRNGTSKECSGVFSKIEQSYYWTFSIKGSLDDNWASTLLTPSLFFSLSDLSILLSDPFYKTEFLVLTATIWCLTSPQQEVI